MRNSGIIFSLIFSMTMIISQSLHAGAFKTCGSYTPQGETTCSGAVYKMGGEDPACYKCAWKPTKGPKYHGICIPSNQIADNC